MPIVDPDLEKKEDDEFMKAFLEEDAKTAGDATEQQTDVDGESEKDQLTDDAAKPADEDPIKPDTDQDTDTSKGLEANECTECARLTEELKKERQRTSSWDGRIKAANEKAKKLEDENAQLREQVLSFAKQQDNDDAKSDEEKLQVFREAFPELVDVVDIMEKKINKIKDTRVKDEQKTVKPEEESTSTTEESNDAGQEDAKSSEPTDHYKTVTKAHPELDEMVGTGAVLTWLRKQPEFISEHLEDIYYARNGQGTSTQVIKLLNEFKKSTGWKSQLAERSSAKKKHDKLTGMLESEGESPGLPKDGPDKNDFEGTAKAIGL